MFEASPRTTYKNNNKENINMSIEAINKLIELGISEEEAKAIVAKATAGQDTSSDLDTLFPSSPSYQQDSPTDTVDIGSLKVGHTQQERKEYMATLRKQTEVKVAKQMAEASRIYNAPKIAVPERQPVKGTAAWAIAQMNAYKKEAFGIE